MDYQFYDTYSNTKKIFTPLDSSNVRMYVCGPTVYDYAHVGNARPVIVFDIVYRMLQLKYGADHVTYVRNITDVDDKIIEASNSLNEDITFVNHKTSDINSFTINFNMTVVNKLSCRKYCWYKFRSINNCI